MEVMGLHLPGSSFVNPGTPLRTALTAEAGRQVTGLTALGDNHTPVGEMIDERAIVNGCVALLATGGSTNHTMHLVAIAQAAGITLTWDDISELSAVVPLLARIYPNGSADVNHFHAAGGLGFTIALTARRGPAARGRADRGRTRIAPLHAGTQARRGRRDVARRHHDEPRHVGAARRRRARSTTTAA